jgi:predicted permease
MLVANAPAGIPRIEQAGINWPVALFAAAAAAVSAVMSGLLPALRLSRRDLQSTLRAAGRQSGGSTRDWVRRGLIAAEVALSLPVLIGAGLLIQSALALRTVDPGFRMDHVTVARLIVPGDDAVASTAAIDQVVADLSHRPGVVSASATSAAPLGPGGSSNGLIPDGAVPSPATIVQSQMRMVTAGYLATMQLHLQGGRWIDATDRGDAPSVVVLSQAAAHRLFPGTSAIGKRIECCQPNGVRTVIGVVADVRSRGPSEDVQPEFYVPIAQAPDAAWGWINHAFSMAVRTTTDDAALASRAIRSSVRSVLPAAPVYGITTMHDALRSTLAVERFDTTLLVGLGLVGMLLAAIGIYGVVSYFVTLRTQEIGIRMALGAHSGRVLWWMAWQGVLPIAVGLAIGLGLALLSTALLESTLHGVTARDPLTFLAVTGLLLISGTVASVIPARRASRLDPMRSIR